MSYFFALVYVYAMFYIHHKEPAEHEYPRWTKGASVLISERQWRAPPGAALGASLYRTSGSRLMAGGDLIFTDFRNPYFAAGPAIAFFLYKDRKGLFFKSSRAIAKLDDGLAWSFWTRQKASAFAVGWSLPLGAKGSYLLQFNFSNHDYEYYGHRGGLLFTVLW